MITQQILFRRRSARVHAHAGGSARRKALLAPFAIALSAALFAGCSSGGGQAPDTSDESSAPLEEVTLRLQFVHPVSGAMPAVLGDAHGIFKEEGIELKVEDGKGSATTGESVASGKDDFGVVDAAAAIALISKGADIRAIFSAYDVNSSTVLVGADSGIKTPKDLAGKSVASTAGDAPTQLLPALLEANDVSPSSVKVVSAAPTAKLGLLIKGDVQGALSGAPFQANLKSKGFDASRIDFKDFGVATPGLWIVASTSTIENKPDLVKKFVKAMQKSKELLASSSAEDVAKAMSEKYPDITVQRALGEQRIGMDFLQYTDSANKTPGYIDKTFVSDAIQMFVKYGLIDSAPEVSKVFTNEFVEK